jgi:hypothetical protein
MHGDHDRRSRMRTITLLATTLLLSIPTAAGAVPPKSDGVDRPGPYCPKRTDQSPREGKRFDASRLEGKTLRDARRLARKHQCSVRVVRLNGAPLVITDDFSSDRINVSVVGGRVKRAVGVF